MLWFSGGVTCPSGFVLFEEYVRSCTADNRFRLNKDVLWGRRDDGSVLDVTCLLSEHQSWDFSNCTEWFTTSARPGPWGFMPSSDLFRCTPKSGIHKQSHMYIKNFFYCFWNRLENLNNSPASPYLQLQDSTPLKLRPPLWVFSSPTILILLTHSLVGNGVFGSADLLD